MSRSRRCALYTAVFGVFVLALFARASAEPIFKPPLKETCPAAIVIPERTDGPLSMLGFALSAVSARTITGHIVVRTDHGWFKTEVHDVRLGAASLHYTQGSKSETLRKFLSPALFLDFPSPVHVISAWIVDARSVGDAEGWEAQGNFTCDPPQGDPLQPPRREVEPVVLAADDLVPFLAPTTKSMVIPVKAATPLDTSCAKPFADGRVISVGELEYPYVTRMPPGTTIVSLLISHDGALLDAEIFKSSQDTAFDIAALQAAARSTYAPPIAYCRPVNGRYLFKAVFR